MCVNKNLIRDLLAGDDAFYNKSDREYKADFTSIPPVVYSVETDKKIARVIRDILSVIIFPIGLYRLLHRLIGPIIVPAVHEKRDIRPLIGQADGPGFKYKRIRVIVDGAHIEAVIIRNRDIPLDRWVLSSLGNAQSYEDVVDEMSGILQGDFRRLLDGASANAVVFNYPGVGGSSGWLTKNRMVEAYRAMLQFLEDKEAGIGAKEIIGYGYSIGAGVQAEALKSHALKSDIKYVFVKNKSFSTLTAAISDIYGRVVAAAAWLFGWRLDSTASSSGLHAPEIIVQTGNVDRSTLINNDAQIMDDGVISKEAALASALLADAGRPKEGTTFIAVRDGHNEPLLEPEFLADQINKCLMNGKE